MTKRPWIGVDLDGTLAVYDGWRGAYHIGEPIAPMVERVRRWLDGGLCVKIFTARVDGSPEYVAEVKTAINEWVYQHLGTQLEITNVKDHGMTELWDDRAVQVEPNTGRRVDHRVDE